MDGGFNLYEFPTDHIGRKRYVHVNGHSRSVPAMYTYRGVDGRNYIHPDFGGDSSGMGAMAPAYMPDIQGFVSPVDGAYIGSRSEKRDHVRAHSLIEVGDQVMRHSGGPAIDMPRVGSDVRRAIDQLRNR